MRSLRPTAALLLLAAAAPLAGCGADAAKSTTAPPADAQAELTAAALRAAMPSVVAVSVTQYGSTHTGTGTLLAKDQIVVDAALVGKNASTTAPPEVSVREASGDEHDATVEGTDPLSGLTVLRVSELDTVPPATGGPAPKLGQPVAALAYLSARRPAVRPGAIATTGRGVRNGVSAEVGLMEATASLGGQGVGGPLVDSQGRIVAITTRALVPIVPGTVVALPYASAVRVAHLITTEGRVRRAYLGVETVGITPTRAEELQLKTNSGVLIARRIPGSPAAVSALRGPTGTTTIGGRTIPTGGDAIVAVDGHKIVEPEDLDAILATLRPGHTAAIRVIRGSQSVVVRIPLGER